MVIFIGEGPDGGFAFIGVEGFVGAGFESEAFFVDYGDFGHLVISLFDLVYDIL